jgi:hypothetical protein
MPKTVWQECTLCGYLIPFDPAFELEAIHSSKKVITIDGETVTVTDVILEMGCHLEEHDELWGEDNELDRPLNEIFRTREVENNA